MNVFTDISLLDLRRIEPPFAIGFQPSSSGMGRSSETFASIPRRSETAAASLGRAATTASDSLGRAADQ